MIDQALKEEIVTALDWYVDQGVTTVVSDEVVDRTVTQEISVEQDRAPRQSSIGAGETKQAVSFLGKSDAYEDALKRAQAVSTLEELRETIASFDGIALKKTASNMVFSDGNPKAKVMLVGEAPGADEDRLGKPFVGVSGQLLDKILKCIDLERYAEDPEKAVYISNILNWRPPGNRTPSPGEIEVSLPFIERHIQLIQPEILIFCGGVSAKSLLASSSSISRLRKVFHEYRPITKGVGDKIIPAIATYHPSYLLRTPQQKKSVWADMLMLRQRIETKDKS